MLDRQTRQQRTGLVEHTGNVLESINCLLIDKITQDDIDMRRADGLVRFDLEPCPCGRTYLRLDGGILGEPLTTFAVDQGLVARLSEDFIDSFTATVIY